MTFWFWKDTRCRIHDPDLYITKWKFGIGSIKKWKEYATLLLVESKSYQTSRNESKSLFNFFVWWNEEAIILSTQSWAKLRCNRVVTFPRIAASSSKIYILNSACLVFTIPPVTDFYDWITVMFYIYYPTKYNMQLHSFSVP